MWFLKLCLDLNIFPHILQEWETPVIWWASMWSWMFLYVPSFPHTVHPLSRPWFPLCSLVLIIDLIFWSRSFRSLTMAWSGSATEVSSVLAWLSILANRFWSFWPISPVSTFSSTSTLDLKDSAALDFSLVSPFSFRSCASARKASKWSCSTLASPW